MIAAAPQPAHGAGLVVWLTGLPSSGKSTLAVKLADRLRAQGVSALVLDGDEVRAALRPSPGYDDASRDAFYETLARLATLLARQGSVILVPATAHRRAFRTRARALAPAFLELWVDTPLSDCARRDAKGLYQQSAAHGTSTLPGAQLGYETPEPDDHALRILPDQPWEPLVDTILRARREKS